MPGKTYDSRFKSRVALEAIRGDIIRCLIVHQFASIHDALYTAGEIIFAGLHRPEKIAGRISGSTILLNVRKLLAPNVIEASSRDRSICCSAATAERIRSA